MAISRQLYNNLKQKYGEYASWAIWDQNNIKKLPVYSKIMRTDVVFVALNATTKTDIWEAFHVRDKYDRVFADIVNGTNVCGAYCTDLFKGPVNNVFNPNSIDVWKYMTDPSNKTEFDGRCADFFDELKNLGNVETVFVFGDVAFKLVKKYLEDQGFIFPKTTGNVLNAQCYQFVELTHYSYRFGRNRIINNQTKINNIYP